MRVRNPRAASAFDGFPSRVHRRVLADHDYRAEDEQRAAEHEFAFAADAARRRTFFDRIYRINRI